MAAEQPAASSQQQSAVSSVAKVQGLRIPRAEVQQRLRYMCKEMHVPFHVPVSFRQRLERFLSARDEGTMGYISNILPQILGSLPVR